MTSVVFMLTRTESAPKAYRLQTVSPGSSLSQTRGYSSQQSPSPPSRLTRLNQTNRGSAAADCFPWTFGIWLTASLISVDRALVRFLKFSRCATYRLYFLASRQIAVEEHKRWAAYVLQEKERERERGVLARTPPLCGYKETYLVPGGGLFTRLTLTSAKSPL